MIKAKLNDVTETPKIAEKASKLKAKTSDKSETEALESGEKTNNKRRKLNPEVDT